MEKCEQGFQDGGKVFADVFHHFSSGAWHLLDLLGCPPTRKRTSMMKGQLWVLWAKVNIMNPWSSSPDPPKKRKTLIHLVFSGSSWNFHGETWGNSICTEWWILGNRGSWMELICSGIARYIVWYPKMMSWIQQIQTWKSLFQAERPGNYFSIRPESRMWM